MTTETTLQQLAETVRAFFVQDKRNDGTAFWKQTDGTPEWVQELCLQAHGDMMPDDWRYAFIVEALDAIAEHDDPDDIALEPDIYTHELTSWLGSRADRFGYCDDEMSCTGMEFTGTIELLQMGQAAEKREVLDSVRASLESRLETEDEETEDEDYDYSSLTREQCVTLLRSIGIECDDSDTYLMLRCIVEASIDDGSLDRDQLP